MDMEEGELKFSEWTNSTRAVVTIQMQKERFA